jgi:hypothetical protein
MDQEKQKNKPNRAVKAEAARKAKEEAKKEKDRPAGFLPPNGTTKDGVPLLKFLKPFYYFLGGLDKHHFMLSRLPITIDNLMAYLLSGRTAQRCCATIHEKVGYTGSLDSRGEEETFIEHIRNTNNNIVQNCACVECTLGTLIILLQGAPKKEQLYYGHFISIMVRHRLIIPAEDFRTAKKDWRSYDAELNKLTLSFEPQLRNTVSYAMSQADAYVSLMNEIEIEDIKLGEEFSCFVDDRLKIFKTTMDIHDKNKPRIIEELRLAAEEDAKFRAKIDAMRGCTCNASYN